MIAKDRAMVRDVVTSLIETNRMIYKQKEKGDSDHDGGDQETSGRGQLRL